MGQTTSKQAPDFRTPGVLHAIPPIDTMSGHLPPGRYRTTLSHIRHRFVDHQDFANSTTRQEIWDGLLSYLQAWRESEIMFNQQILHTLWIAGSFISDVVDPNDIDVSPVYDEVIIGSLASKPGIGSVKTLIGHRQKLVHEYRVEPFPIPWRSLESTLNSKSLLDDEQNYLAKRGGLDDWWQRVRPPGPKRESVAPTVAAVRGYLEVMW